MARRQLPPVAAVISFIDCINRGDTDGLGLLITDDHEPAVFDEEPLRGKEPNIEAWNGYATAFPDYVIYPRVVAEPGQGQVAVLGHTTGSHLGLSDQEERRLSIIWLAETENGRLRCWRLLLLRQQTGVTYWLAPQRRVILLTVFSKTRSAETAEVARALHPRRPARASTAGHTKCSTGR